MAHALKRRLAALNPNPKIAVFVDKYPLVGPAFWLASLQYGVLQVVVAVAWQDPTYSWRHNAISDLGNTACGAYYGRAVCSPEYWLMDISFIVLGLTMAAGSWLIYHEFRREPYSLCGFIGMALAGVGTILVGVFPENVNSILHSTGALLAFGVGDLALVAFGVTLPMGKVMRTYTFASGVVGLAGLMLYATHTYLGIGLGGMERVAGYPQTAWLIVFGVYMMRNHFKRR